MRSVVSKCLLVFLASVSMSSFSFANPVVRPAEEKARIENIVSKIAKDLSEKCPLAKPNDLVAFDRCRAFIDDTETSAMKQTLNTHVLWGRIPANPEARLKDYGTTQFAPDVLTGMYLPTFMFSGQSKVEFNETEGLYRAELGVAYRNQMPPGEYPYPFWHEENKWSQYQDAKTIAIWINPETGKIISAQFSPKGSLDAVMKSDKVDHKFDGNWSWTDADGKQQPKLTLFDGAYSSANPHLAKLDETYRDLALSLREGQCMSCHVPNNPDKMKKLVLLQTPRHAAAEIERVMDDVRRDKMPLTKWGTEEPLPQAIKDVFLKRGDAFASTIKMAKEWEAANKKPLKKAEIKQ